MANATLLKVKPYAPAYQQHLVSKSLENVSNSSHLRLIKLYEMLVIIYSVFVTLPMIKLKGQDVLPKGHTEV